MKNLLLTTTIFLLAFTTKAQTLEGEWHFVKMNLFGAIIYLDDSDKDKENLVKSWIKAREMGMKADKKTSEQIDTMKRELRANKERLYAIAKTQYAGVLDFKNLKEVYDGEDDGKVYFNDFDENDKIELVESRIRVKDNVLKLKDKDLFENDLYTITLKGKKLILTDFDEPPFIYYFERN